MKQAIFKVRASKEYLKALRLQLKNDKTLVNNPVLKDAYDGWVYERTCKICEKSFKTESRTKQICSDECKHEAICITKRKHYEALKVYKQRRKGKPI